MKFFLVEAPVLSSQFDVKSNIKPLDINFEERLAAVKRLYFVAFCICMLVRIGFKMVDRNKNFKILKEGRRLEKFGKAETLIFHVFYNKSKFLKYHKALYI